MSQNMKGLKGQLMHSKLSDLMLPNTKFYNFSRKFYQVAALSWTLLGPQGPEISLGPRPLPHPWNRPWLTATPIQESTSADSRITCSE